MVIIDYEIVDENEVVQTGWKGTMERVVADVKSLKNLVFIHNCIIVNNERYNHTSVSSVVVVLQY